MKNEIIDLYPYDIPDGFHPGIMFAGTFINVFISNQENLSLAPGHPNFEDKPKYAFSCAFPCENRKTFVRESQSVKFSCTDTDFNYLKSVYDRLKFQPVYLTCVPDSWGSGSKHGLFYRYVSGSVRRFDGKPLSDGKLSEKSVTDSK